MRPVVSCGDAFNHITHSSLLMESVQGLHSNNEQEMGERVTLSQASGRLEKRWRSAIDKDRKLVVEMHHLIHFLHLQPNPILSNI